MTPDTLTEFVASEFSSLADPEAAYAMAAYMKTEMQFYGIKKPARAPVVKEMIRRFPPQNPAEYRERVLGLWGRPHREEKYAALAYARGFTEFIRASEIPLYERLIREGAWWDLVDDIAIKLVGGVMLKEPIWETIDPWIDDADLWICRSALICQIDHKEMTDERRLFSFCLRRAADPEFFIRKAIGWSLRQYSYTAPEAVIAFLRKHRARLAGLSYREGAKALIRQGYEL